MSINNKVIAIVGLGYVGLPLAIELGKVIRRLALMSQKLRLKTSMTILI